MSEWIDDYELTFVWPNGEVGEFVGGPYDGRRRVFSEDTVKYEALGDDLAEVHLYERREGTGFFEYAGVKARLYP